MGKVVSCDECRKAYRTLEALEDLRDNDGICLVCNNPIEVDDWDRVLASYEDDDFDDVPEDVDEDDFGDDFDDDMGGAFDEIDGEELANPALAGDLGDDDRGDDDLGDDDLDDEDDD